MDQIANAIGQAANWLVGVLESGWWAGVGSFATLLAVIVALGALVLDRRERTRSERMRQARQVSGWVEWWQSSEPETDDHGPIHGFTRATLLNASDVPVYRVIAWLVLYPGAPGTGEEVARGIEHGGDGPTTIGVLPPGSYKIDLPEFAPGMMKRPVIEVAFTDSAGRHWIRRQDGALKEIKKAPAYHYGLGEPLDWDRAGPPD
jgi:hypothetical protein